MLTCAAYIYAAPSWNGNQKPNSRPWCFRCWQCYPEEIDLKKNVSTGVIHWKLPGEKMLPLSIIPDGYVAYQPSPGLLAPHGF